MRDVQPGERGTDRPPFLDGAFARRSFDEALGEQHGPVPGGDDPLADGCGHRDPGVSQPRQPGQFGRQPGRTVVATVELGEHDQTVAVQERARVGGTVAEVGDPPHPPLPAELVTHHPFDGDDDVRVPAAHGRHPVARRVGGPMVWTLPSGVRTVRDRSGPSDTTHPRSWMP